MAARPFGSGLARRDAAKAPSEQKKPVHSTRRVLRGKAPLGGDRPRGDAGAVSPTGRLGKGSRSAPWRRRHRGAVPALRCVRSRGLETCGPPSSQLLPATASPWGCLFSHLDLPPNLEPSTEEKGVCGGEGAPRSGPPFPRERASRCQCELRN